MANSAKRRPASHTGKQQDNLVQKANKATRPISPQTFSRSSLVLLALVLPFLAWLCAPKYTYGLSDTRHHDKLSPAFEVVDLPGRGKGIIAVRDIEQGELLIKEAPLITVPPTINTSPTAFLQQKLDTLTPAQKEEFFSLSYVLPGQNRSRSLSQPELALAIFQTNGIQAGDRVGLFPRTARLNHGCSAAFNAVYSWREKEGNLVVHALKPIKAHQELLTTYTDTKRTRAERQDYLRENYDFTCSCAVCSLPEAESKASDARLSRMTSLYHKFKSWGQGDIDGPEAISTVNEIWRLGTLEGYWSERGRLAADAAYVAASHSDLDAVLSWARLAQKWFAIELGDDTEQSAMMRILMSDPRSHPAWATRPPQKVGSPLDSA